MPCDGRCYGRLVKEELDPFVDYPIVGQHALGMLPAYRSLD